MGLEKIRRAITDPGFDSVAVLTSHLTELSRRRIELDTLIANVQKSIKERQGEYIMSDDERFEGLKRRLVEQNERQYGAEVRAQYGDDVMNLVNQKSAVCPNPSLKRQSALNGMCWMRFLWP